MHAGKLTIAAIAVTSLFLSSPASANKKADGKSAAQSDSKSEAKEKAPTKTAAKAPKKVAVKASPKTPKKAAVPAKGKKPTIEPAPAVDVSDIYEETAWFDQPIAPKAKPAKLAKGAQGAKGAKRAKNKASVKVPTSKKGVGAIGLGPRRDRRGPVVVETNSKAKRLDRNKVVTVLRQNEPSIAYCRSKSRHSATQLVLRFRVDTKGNASAVKVTTLAGKTEKKISRCLSSRMRSWAFPSGSDGGAIEYPILVQEIGPASR